MNLEAARTPLAVMTLGQVIILILILILILHYYSGAAEAAVVQRDLQHWAHPQLHGEGGLRPAAADEGGNQGLVAAAGACLPGLGAGGLGGCRGGRYRRRRI